MAHFLQPGNLRKNYTPTRYIHACNWSVTFPTMPRLKIPNELRQQGYAHSVQSDTVKTKKKRKTPPPPLGSDRASRSKTAAAATGAPIRKQRKHVKKSPNSLAKLILD